MLFLRASTRAVRVARQTALFRPSPSTTFTRFTSSDYGSGSHNNEPNSSVHKEHPGPPPPNTSSSYSSSASSSSSSNDSSSSSKNAPQPKILNESPPEKGQESEDVRKHNEEMAKRADRAEEQVNPEDIEKDKVGKGFWKG